MLAINYRKKQERASRAQAFAKKLEVTSEMLLDLAEFGGEVQVPFQLTAEGNLDEQPERPEPREITELEMGIGATAGPCPFCKQGDKRQAGNHTYIGFFYHEANCSKCGAYGTICQICNQCRTCHILATSGYYPLVRDCNWKLNTQCIRPLHPYCNHCRVPELHARYPTYNGYKEHTPSNTIKGDLYAIL